MFIVPPAISAQVLHFRNVFYKLAQIKCEINWCLKNGSCAGGCLLIKDKFLVQAHYEAAYFLQDIKGNEQVSN